MWSDACLCAPQDIYVKQHVVSMHQFRWRGCGAVALVCENANEAHKAWTTMLQLRLKYYQHKDDSAIANLFPAIV